jgi:hypothetical protein
MKRILWLAALIAAAAVPGPAGGCDAGGRWTIHPSIGFMLPVRLGRLVPLANTADVPGVDILLESRGPQAAFSLGRRLSRRVEIQAEAAYGRAAIMEDVGIGFAGIPLGKSEVSPARAWTLGARLLVGLGGRVLEPYLSVGLGAATLDIEERGARTQLGAEIGAGLRANLSSHLRVVLEARDAISLFDYFADFRIFYAMIYTAESLSLQHRLGARLGLGYIF